MASWDAAANPTPTDTAPTIAAAAAAAPKPSIPRDDDDDGASTASTASTHASTATTTGSSRHRHGARSRASTTTSDARSAIGQILSFGASHSTSARVADADPQHHPPASPEAGTSEASDGRSRPAPPRPKKAAAAAKLVGKSKAALSSHLLSWRHFLAPDIGRLIAQDRQRNANSTLRRTDSGSGARGRSSVNLFQAITAMKKGMQLHKLPHKHYLVSKAHLCVLRLSPDERYLYWYSQKRKSEVHLRIDKIVGLHSGMPDGLKSWKSALGAHAFTIVRARARTTHPPTHTHTHRPAASRAPKPKQA